MELFWALVLTALLFSEPRGWRTEGGRREYSYKLAWIYLYMGPENAGTRERWREGWETVDVAQVGTRWGR